MLTVEDYRQVMLHCEDMIRLINSPFRWHTPENEEELQQKECELHEWFKEWAITLPKMTAELETLVGAEAANAVCVKVSNLIEDCRPYTQDLKSVELWSIGGYMLESESEAELAILRLERDLANTLLGVQLQAAA